MSKRQVKVENTNESEDVVYLYTTFPLTIKEKYQYTFRTENKGLVNQQKITEEHGTQIATLVDRLIVKSEIPGIQRITFSVYELTIVKYHGFDWANTDESQEKGMLQGIVDMLHVIFGDFNVLDLRKYNYS